MGETYTEPSKELLIYGRYDVVVAGGGCAGFGAAIAAARNGARTLIVERFPFFGGTATAGLMTKMNGFRNQVEPDDIQTSRGIAEELILRLKNIDGFGPPPYPKCKVYPTTPGQLSFSYGFDPEKMKLVMLEMVVESGADILFHTYISDVIMDGDCVQGIIIENKSGRQAVFGYVVIDASGDADVAFKAGVPFWQVKGDEGPRLDDGLMYRITNTDDLGDRWCNRQQIIWGPRAPGVDCTDADALTQAEIQTRLALLRFSFDHGVLFSCGCLVLQWPMHAIFLF